MAPNATLQAPPIAEARHERRLLAVACKRLLDAARVPRSASGAALRPPRARLALPRLRRLGRRLPPAADTAPHAAWEAGARWRVTWDRARHAGPRAPPGVHHLWQRWQGLGPWPRLGYTRREACPGPRAAVVGPRGPTRHDRRHGACLGRLRHGRVAAPIWRPGPPQRVWGSWAARHRSAEIPPWAGAGSSRAPGLGPRSHARTSRVHGVPHGHGRHARPRS